MVKPVIVIDTFPLEEIMDDCDEVGDSIDLIEQNQRFQLMRSINKVHQKSNNSSVIDTFSEHMIGSVGNQSPIKLN